jgi:hypothetical protein
MKSQLILIAAFSAFLLLNPGAARAAPINLITLSCAKYQGELLAAPATTPGADGINTVMWLFGYSVARSGAHVMYGDALAGFGFGLDAECKNNPDESLMDALLKIKPSDKNPMDLSTLGCLTFSTRHLEMARTDRESADTIMMWLFGFATGRSGGHFFEPEGLTGFESAFLGECTKHPERSLFDALSSMKF